MLSSYTITDISSHIKKSSFKVKLCVGIIFIIIFIIMIQISNYDPHIFSFEIIWISTRFVKIFLLFILIVFFWIGFDIINTIINFLNSMTNKKNNENCNII